MGAASEESIFAGSWSFDDDLIDGKASMVERQPCRASTRSCAGHTPFLFLCAWSEKKSDVKRSRRSGSETCLSITLRNLDMIRIIKRESNKGNSRQTMTSQHIHAHNTMT